MVDICDSEDALVQLIVIAKSEAKYNPFYVMLGEALWTRLYATDKVTALQYTVSCIQEHS
jgi:hypothetical protein